jgi:hypothetical protein
MAECIVADHLTLISFVRDMVVKMHGSKAQNSPSDPRTVLEYNKVKPWVRLRNKALTSADSKPI